MGTIQVPAAEWPVERRVQATVPYQLWYVEEFPTDGINGKLDKDIEERPWIMGLLADIRSAGHLRNPLIIWNHHPLRGTKQPRWLLRAGSNRMWCVDQLEWKTVPAVVSTTLASELPPGVKGFRINPREVQGYFPDGGIIWVNDYGWGLQLAKAPEITYKDHQLNPAENALIRPTNLRRNKIIRP